MSPQQFKEAVRNMRFWQKYYEDDPTTFSKSKKKDFENEVDYYLKTH